jgi:hypothetical protein
MHPRRWGFFEAALDSQNRPVFGINGPGVQRRRRGDAAGYGRRPDARAARLHRREHPDEPRAGTNEDSIIVFAIPVVHLWERENDPVTLSVRAAGGHLAAGAARRVRVRRLHGGPLPGRDTPSAGALGGPSQIGGAVSAAPARMSSRRPSKLKAMNAHPDVIGAAEQAVENANDALAALGGHKAASKRPRSSAKKQTR